MAEPTSKKDDRREPPRGPNINVFASAPEGGNAIEVKDDGKCNITLVFSHAFANPNFASAANVAINGTPVGYVRVGKAGEKKTYRDLKLDLTKPIKVEVIQIGSNAVFSLTLPAPNPPPESKDSKGTSAPATRRFNVTVFPLTVDRFNPINLVCKDEQGKPVKGTVHVSLGQPFVVKGDTGSGYDSEHDFLVPDDGHLLVSIRLSACDTLGVFQHKESGEVVNKTLLYEE